MLSLTPKITIFIQRCSNIFATLLKIYLRRKLIFRTLCYSRANPWIRNNFQIARNNITRSRINIFRVLIVSRIRDISFDMKIRNKFIEIKYNAPNRFIIFITDDWYLTILKIMWRGWLSRFSSKYAMKISKDHPFINERNFNKMRIILESMTGRRACWL